ncbi:MAG TPA: pyruvate dehydrogenase complex E1 component subunit beta [Armatimonadota bacterium]|nr:pyruvate dehydrogenase complex E1 component subunit beta [Armatimonadota bacterium]
MSTLEAMIDALRIEMRRDPSVIYLGEGTGERGGTYGHTLGLFAEFGPTRMIDTPISELGFTGACIGAAVNGCRPIADLMFMDFVADAMTQVVNQAAKLRYMSNGQVGVPMVLWAGVGAIKSAGPHHSGCLYPWFMHIPGLKVVIPSNPADAKGLLATAIRDNDPVVYCAHKLLFARRAPVPEGEHLVPLGKAAVAREGEDATIIATGMMVSLALEAAEQLSARGVSCEVLDLRSLVPLDTEAVVASATKTGRVLVVDEAYSTCGVGAEIAAVVNERAFSALRAPVLRLHTAAVSHPFSPVFDAHVLPQVDGIIEKIALLLQSAPSATAASAPDRAAAPRLAAAPAALAPVGATSAPTATAPARPANGRVPVLIPNQGLTVEEAKIVRWLVRAGDRVRAGQPLYEIETDKVVVEVEAELAGVVDEIVVREDETRPLGTCVAWLRES